MPFSVKITEKGQVTLPKAIRDFLNSKIIEFEIEDNRVVVKPVASIGGSLARYAKEYRSLAEIRELVFEEVAREKAQITTS